TQLFVRRPPPWARPRLAWSGLAVLFDGPGTQDREEQVTGDRADHVPVATRNTKEAPHERERPPHRPSLSGGGSPGRSLSVSLDRGRSPAPRNSTHIPGIPNRTAGGRLSEAGQQPAVDLLGAGRRVRSRPPGGRTRERLVVRLRGQAVVRFYL